MFTKITQDCNLDFRVVSFISLLVFSADTFTVHSVHSRHLLTTFLIFSTVVQFSSINL